VKRVLCWDVDGTLLSTARAGVFALEEAARELCGETPDLGALKTAGLTDGQVAARTLEHCGVEPSADRVTVFLRRYEHHLPERLHWRQGRVLPGVAEILEDLGRRPDARCLLLTGNTSTGAAAKLDHYGLASYFAGGAFCENGEPREEIAARARGLAADWIGAEPGDGSFYVIGDTPHDVRCGHAVGARPVAVASGDYPRAELEAYDPWRSLDRLPEPAQFAELLGLEEVG
jgi:phosphoglycolate phosphatase